MAPLVTFVVVCVLLLLARFYEQLPVRAPTCQFRSVTGFPCVGCGGTRSMKALAHGDVASAFAFNPAIVLLVFGIAGWLLWRWICYRRNKAQPETLWSRKKVVTVVLAILFLLAANWLYLVFYLPIT